jgi:pyruvate formate lyase activating enzyme
MGVLLEVTNLVIPTLNDGDDQIRTLCRWIVENLGRETPLHFSRFFPHYRMRHLPPTPPETLDRARQIGKAEGLHHVYIGNILRPGGEDTHCPGCDRLLVQRRRYTILKNEIDRGRCPGCGTEVHGIWK